MANIVRSVTFPVGARAVERDIFVRVSDVIGTSAMLMFDTVSINTLSEFINVLDNVNITPLNVTDSASTVIGVV